MLSRVERFRRPLTYSTRKVILRVTKGLKQNKRAFKLQIRMEGLKLEKDDNNIVECQE